MSLRLPTPVSTYAVFATSLSAPVAAQAPSGPLPFLAPLTTNLVLGMVGRTRGGWRWEAGLQEDVSARGPSNDFTLRLSLGKTW